MLILENYCLIFIKNEWTILDYLPKHSPIFFDDFQKIMNKNAQFQLEATNLLTESLQKVKLLQINLILQIHIQYLESINQLPSFQIFIKD